MTDIDHNDLTTRLTALTEEFAPPADFDVAAAVATGQARLRRRRRASIGAVAVATALTVGFTALLQPDGGASPALPPTAATAPASPTTAPAVPRPDADDLLRSELRFGWLPDWANRELGISFASGPDASSITAADTGTSGRNVQVFLRAPGPEPALAGSLPGEPNGPAEAKVPAPPVDGRTAYWVEHPTNTRYDTSRRVLRWLTASGRWAQLDASHYAEAAIPDADLLRIASTVVYETRGIPLPIRLGPLPAGVRLDKARLDRPAGPLGWTATVGVSVEDRKVEIQVAPDGAPPQYRLPVIECRHERGRQLCASALPDSVPTVDRHGGLVGLLDLVHLTDADEGAWTNEGLR
ncbi:hypothetical protein [Streptomyces rubellomurinus]|uniref:Uncharacterized protein n=1 Tax=Streptomyces rubellomurinus (strain ATCC 31215) TaxID=359131 RepID=A0A0F2T7G2_STRR3|nr:hypothetical protein [Streptomyces rubellomurinus]KJS59159.1 hypothetical protein VM95_28770 [Streptomyces rubellomurinus]